MQGTVETTIQQLRDTFSATSDSDLAKKLRIDKSTVSSWRSRGRVPSRFVKLLDEQPPREQAQAPDHWNELQETALGLSQLRFTLMTKDIAVSGDVERAMITFMNTKNYWAVLYRAVHEIQEKQSALNVDHDTAAALLMQEDLREPEATGARVRADLEQDLKDSPHLENWPQS